MRKSSFNKLEDKKSDPISLYNIVITQYNNPVNSLEALPLAYSDSLYRAWYKLLFRYYLIALLCYLAPYLSVLTIIFTLYTIIVHENSLSVYRQNSLHGIFENMIPCDSLCERNDENFIYFDVNKEDLRTFPFSQNIVNILRNRADETTGKVRFMVYDRVFLGWSEGLKKPRWKLFFHLFLNFVLFIVMQVLVYKPFLCFDFFHPINSISRCF